MMRTWPPPLVPRRFLILLLIGGLLLPLLVACSGSAPARSSSVEQPPATDAGGAGSSAPAGAAAAPTTVAVAGSGAKPGAAPAPGQPTNQGQGTNAPLPQQQRLIIKTGTLGLIVKGEDIDSLIAQIAGVALKYGGDVLQSSVSKSGDARVADLVIQVNSGQFEAAMQELRGAPGVVERKVDKTEGKDVTEEFVDVKAQITNLEATERQLRAVMEKATRTDDILAIQREITNVRGQIDRLQGRANYLERRAAMSTITIHLEPPALVATRTPAAGWRFADVVTRAWDASLRSLQGIATVVITVVVFFWWAIPLLALGAFLLRRNRRGHRPAAAPPAPPSAPAAPTTGD